jgi:hypothetical protein
MEGYRSWLVARWFRTVLSSPKTGILTIGLPLPVVSTERLEFLDDLIVADVRNTAPDTTEIAQTDVNDKITSAAIEPSKTLPMLAC